VRAAYTCGPADGPLIAMQVRTAQTLTVMAELIVAGTERGRSARLRVVARVETPVEITPRLTAEAWAIGVGTVELQQVDELNASSEVLASERVVLRLPPGTGCG
jgi:hypothetical protein